MNKVEITVLKTTFDHELAEKYGVPGLGACPMLRAGQVFYADYAKPDGFCDEAWKAIYQYVFALAHGAGGRLFYYGDWSREPGVARCSCNDGLRPVIYKLEATDTESEIDYEPVRQAGQETRPGAGVRTALPRRKALARARDGRQGRIPYCAAREKARFHAGPGAPAIRERRWNAAGEMVAKPGTGRGKRRLVNRPWPQTPAIRERRWNAAGARTETRLQD